MKNPYVPCFLHYTPNRVTWKHLANKNDFSLQESGVSGGVTPEYSRRISENPVIFCYLLLRETDNDASG